MSNNEWSETIEEQVSLDEFLGSLDQEFADTGDAPNDWVHIALAVPVDFAKIFQDTVEGYKAVTGSDKIFPAFEAMVMEAKNSLPSVQEGLN